jgi:hypothetical protein
MPTLPATRSRSRRRNQVPARETRTAHRLNQFTTQERDTRCLRPLLCLKDHAPQRAAIRTAGPPRWHARKKELGCARTVGARARVHRAAGSTKRFTGRQSSLPTGRATRPQKFIANTSPCFHIRKTESPCCGDRKSPELAAHAVATATTRRSRHSNRFAHGPHKRLQSLPLLRFDLEQLANLAGQADVIFKGECLAL